VACAATRAPPPIPTPAPRQDRPDALPGPGAYGVEPDARPTRLESQTLEAALSGLAAFGGRPASSPALSLAARELAVRAADGDPDPLAGPALRTALSRAAAFDPAPRTVVVVNAATPVLMPWLDRVHAVLWVGLPGQEAGRAVAAALLGDQEPTGRLVTTFPAADAATPAWSVTPENGRLPYREGTFIGYRGHAAGRAGLASVKGRPRLQSDANLPMEGGAR